MRRIVFATHNAHKLGELRAMAPDGIEIVGLDAIGCDEDIPETGATLRANALQKALYVAERYGVGCFADDTGLMVDALGGEPGVMSARYAGEAHDSESNMDLLLQRLEGKADRRARFVTEIALIELDGDGKPSEPRFFTGKVEGEILEERDGTQGFGYDPIFKPEGCDRTFARMGNEAKNAISHRGRAVASLMAYLNGITDKKD